jgi:GNAT superfamily N-acetyltransferase
MLKAKVDSYNSMTTAIKMPDGTVCRTGPNCKRHGGAKLDKSQGKAQKLQSKIDSLFNSMETDAKELPLPDWWDDYQQKRFDNQVEVFKQFGLKSASVPTFHDSAMRHGYISVDTGDKDTKIIVDKDGTYAKQGEKYYCRAWMYKHGKPVAMLRFATYPANYTPPEGTYPYTESVICDIEVRPESLGKGYGMEIIRNVEKNILTGRLIHSGGHYTPEGEKYLGGKLPYTNEAKHEYKKVFADNKTPESSYRSMKFVHDWEELQLLH